MRNRKRCLLMIAIAGIVLSLPEVTRAQIMVWGITANDPAWNRALHVTGARQGCTDAPPSCMRFAAGVNQTSPNVKTFLAVSLDAFVNKDYASQYGKLSVSAPYVEEIGIDDFDGQYNRFFSGQGSAALEQAITRMKSGNPRLKFGITLYENELTRPELQDPKLTRTARAMVDYVHLFPHFRANGPDFEQYVKQANNLFPNAQVIAGSYAYDRIDYVPCSQSHSDPCSFQQELDLHKKALNTQARLLKKGEVTWIEFYAGNFGREGDWQNWRTNPRLCKSTRLQECVDNTVTLHQATLDVLISQGLAEPLATQ